MPEVPSVEVRPAEFLATFEHVIADAKGQVEITLSLGHRLTRPGAFNVDVLLRLVIGMPTP